MIDKHYIRNSGGSWREVNAQLFNISYKWKKDDNIKSWYKQMSSDIVLKGLDYDFVKMFEETSDECKVMDYKIERDSVIEFDGYLDLRGEYKIVGKVFTSKIIDIEKIECLFRDTEINLFDYAIDRWNCKPYYGHLEFATRSEYLIISTNYFHTIGEVMSEAQKWTLYEDETIETYGTYALTGEEYLANTAHHYKWVREVYQGSYTVPPGNGWIQIGSDSWARGVHVTRDEDKETRIEGSNYLELHKMKSWSYLPNVQLTNGIALREVLYHIFDECLYTFKSEFFRDTVTITNEVYDLVSSLFHDIKLYHISDVIYANEPGNATNMKTEKGKFVKEIINYFNQELWRSSEGIHLEHKSYKTRELNLDISGSKYYDSKYKYRSDIAKFEEWVHAENARNDNFKSVKLEYAPNCVREINRTELSESFNILFTDLGSVISNKALWENNDIDKATIVMISVDSDGIINRADTILEKNVMNGCLSFAYLINHLYNYDRKEKSGFVGDIKINNKITGSGKLGTISFPMEVEDFNNITPYNYIKTDNGTAIINALEWENNKCTINYEMI